MFFPQFAARVKAALGKLAQSGFFRSAAEKAGELRDRLWLVVDRLMEKLPPEKRLMVLGAAVGVCAVFVLVLTGIYLMTESDKGREGAAAETVRQGYIPPDDLFLPNEPDFVPGILLEREQRTEWTADDAAPLWQDPLRNGEEPWRNRIERTIDEIMESVP